MKQKKLICWVLFCLLAGGLSGQARVSGKISDEAGQGIRGVNVLLRKQPGTAVVAFGVSDAAGNYSVKLPTGLDSFWLAVTHLSYAPQEQLVYAEQQQLDWVLRAEAYELPVLEVKQEAVVRRGDTLIFDVNQLRRAGDESIEQLLGNIPGITIESSGLIRYQGLEISKFYIEGLDLLEGRYRIATRNLSINAIRDVEIWEHHQPIRALDSLVRPDNAAINLRLKSSIALTGKTELAAGASPALYQVGGDLFGFSKQQQFNVLASANNIGIAQQANFRDLYTTADFRQPLISPTTALPPFLVADENVRDNREKIAGFNLLRKLGKDSQLKWQAYGSTDRLSYQGRNELTLKDGVGEVRFEELLRAQEKPIQLNNRFLYEHNAARFYLKASAEADWRSEQTQAENSINGNPSTEDFQQAELQAKGRFEVLLRKGQKAYQLYNKTDYRNADIDLFLLPLDILSLEIPRLQLEQGLQAARERNFRSDTYTNFIFRVKKLQGQAKVGLAYQAQRLESDLLDQSDNASISLGTDFQNSVSLNRWMPYYTQSYRLLGKANRWTLRWPIALHQVQLNDDLADNSRNFSRWVTKPELEWLRNFPSGNTLSTSYQFALDYDQNDPNFFTGYLLRQNRQLSRGILALNRYAVHELNARWRANSREKSREFESFLVLSVGRYDFLSNTIFGLAGQSSEQIASSNTRQQLRWANRLSGSIHQRWQYKLQLDYRLTAQPIQLNGSNFLVRNHFANLQPYLAFSAKKYIISCKPQLSFFDNNLSDFPVWQQQLTWVYFQQLGKKWGDVRFQFDQFWTQLASSNVQNQLLNVRLKRKITAQKIDISLQLNNLAGSSEYISFSQSSFSETLSYFQLRPRQFVLGLTKQW